MPFLSNQINHEIETLQTRQASNRDPPQHSFSWDFRSRICIVKGQQYPPPSLQGPFEASDSSHAFAFYLALQLKSEYPDVYLRPQWSMENGSELKARTRMILNRNLKLPSRMPADDPRHSSSCDSESFQDAYSGTCGGRLTYRDTSRDG